MNKTIETALHKQVMEIGEAAVRLDELTRNVQYQHQIDEALDACEDLREFIFAAEGELCLMYEELDNGAE